MMAKKKMAKKRKKSSKQSEEEYFVAITDSKAIKIPILEARKEILESLRLFSELKEIRKIKGQEKSQLRKQIKEIITLLNKIRVTLPKVNMPAGDVIIKEEPSKIMVAQPIQKRKQEPEELSLGSSKELDQIELELRAIESKLSSL